MLTPPPRAQAGWYPDPWGASRARYFDGSVWTAAVQPLPYEPPPPHPTLDLRIALGALVVLVVSLVGAKLALDYLVRFDWPIAVFASISIVLGYGPSVAWWLYASRRWGTGDVFADAGVRFRWVDVGWGPLVWVTALGCQVAAAVVVLAFDIPFVSNTEGVNEIDLDRTYVISLLVTAVVAAPIVEEIVFRGLIMRGLRSHLNPALTVGVQGVLFGAAHLDPARGTGNVGLVLVLSAVGVAFGGGAYLLRRIGPTMIAHAVFNGVVMAIVLTR